MILKKNYKPHSTVQKNARINIGDEIVINKVFIVDKEPYGNPSLRKVLGTVNLKQSLILDSANILRRVLTIFDTLFYIFMSRGYVIGLAALPATGKGELAEQLVPLGVEHLHIGSIVRRRTWTYYCI